MKKTQYRAKIIGAFFAVFSINKISGQIGINNSNPKATLDISAHGDDPQKVDGVIAPRLTGSQLKGKDNLYTQEQDGTIIYITEPLSSDQTTDRTINILEKGYYNFDSSKGRVGQWIRMTNAGSITDLTTASSNRGNPLALSSKNAANVTAVMSTKSITIDRPSLVTITFSVPVSDVTLANGEPINDGASKLFATNVCITGPGYDNYLMIRSGQSISNSAQFYTNSGYQLNGSRTLILQAGTYTFQLKPLVYAQDSLGVRANFGDNDYSDTVFDIIAQPMS